MKDTRKGDRHSKGYMAKYLAKWRRGEVGKKYAGLAADKQRIDKGETDGRL